jgi:hypothetical protein
MKDEKLRWFFLLFSILEEKDKGSKRFWKILSTVASGDCH